MITYTNNIEAVKEGLKTIISGEFKQNYIPVVFAEEFEDEHLKSGEYIRLWIEESRFIGAHSDGELKEYEFQINIYFNSSRVNINKDFDNWASEESERLVRLLNNSRYYESSGAYVWHRLTVETPGFLQDLTIIEDFEDEEGLENIKVIPHIVIITRSNFN